jgi:hypothetical protein
VFVAVVNSPISSLTQLQHRLSPRTTLRGTPLDKRSSFEQRLDLLRARSRDHEKVSMPPSQRRAAVHALKECARAVRGFASTTCRRLDTFPVTCRQI